MDNDDRELVRRLFATMTDLLEKAHDASVAGQTDLRNPKAYACAARQLQAMAQQIASLADAALTVAESPGIQLKKHPKSRR